MQRCARCASCPATASDGRNAPAGPHRWHGRAAHRLALEQAARLYAADAALNALVGAPEEA
eukprot:11155025-Lingulodinium_polyedra.AAC.1